MKYRYLSIFLLVLILSVGAVCAQDNSTDDSNVIAASSDDVISVDSNIDVLHDGNESDELKTFSIDDSNFNNYFDENGSMLESANISDYSVIYLGNISNKNLVFDKILTILPNNDSVLTNVGVSFIAGSDNSTFRGLTFQNTNAVTAINVYSASDVLIADNIISTSSEETNGLFAINALYANNLLISSNKITYSSKSNGTVGKYSNAVRIANSDNAVLQGNVFNINISSVDVPWNEVPAASGIWVSDPISEGIVVKDSNNITLSENIITLNTTDIVTEYGYDTVYVVDINNCNDSYFGSNYVTAIGQDYIYGLIVSGENLNITYNTIFAESKLNYANAIDIEGPADVTVENNVLGAISPTAAYAIYGAMSNGNVTAYFDNNTIGAKAYAAFGMEVSGISGNVLNNKITVTGNHTTGIASRFDALAVAGNNITVNGSGEGNQYVWDGFGVENVAIKVIKGLVIIENNTITANGKGIVASDVNLTAESNNITVVDTGLANSYAISVSNCSYVEINENIVKYTGKTNGTYVNNALYVADSAVESIDGNTFEIAIPSVDVAWPEIPAGSGNYVRLPVSEGIVLKNDTNLVFSNNLVYLNATDVITAYGYDTIYVVDVDSDNAVVDNNIIAANGADYVYGLIISGDNFTVSNNAIQVESNNYANGIDVEGPAEGIVDSNVIALTSPISTYGIYAAMSNGNVSVDYINNTIRADSYAAFGIELGGIESNVAYNTIELNGNYTTGIAANLDSLIINDNEIIVNGSGVGNEYVWDGFGVDNVAIKAINGQVAISYNNVTSTGKGLFITKSDLTAERNTITVNDNGLADSYGIYVSDSSDVLIINNGIDFTGNTNGTFINNALYVADSAIDAIEENTFEIAIPSVDVAWPEIPAGSGNYVRIPVSEGIVLKNDTNLVFSTNKVILNATDVITDWGYDTIYVVDVASDDAVVDNNIIAAWGKDYVYGLIISGENLTVTNNTIQSESDSYYANGIDVEGPASGVFEDNVIVVSSPVVAYGIYSSMSGSDVNAIYTNNDIRGEADIIYGMELAGSNETVTENTIVLDGNKTMGIAGKSNILTIEQNEISALGKNLGNTTLWESFSPETVGVKIIAGNATVYGNNIKSTGVSTVNVTTTDASVTYNYLVSNSSFGDASVYFDGNATVHDNLPDYDAFLQTDDIVLYYKNGTRFVAKLVGFYGDPLVNKTITFTLNGVDYNRTTDENGTASIAINLPVGVYDVATTFDPGFNKTPTSNLNTITVLSTIYGDDLVKMFRNESQYYATFLDGQGNPLAEGTNVTFNINGVFYTRQVNGSEGKAKLNINLEPGEYVITAYHPLNKQEYSNNITVLSTIADNADLVKYYKNDSQYVVTILGADGKAVGAGENVTFNINGVMYTRQTNASGQAKLNINLQPGNYTITAMYNGCMVSNDIEVLPILYAEDLYKKYGTSDQFRALLLDGQGNPLSGENITFNINGVFYQRTTNADGYAALNIRLGAAKDIYIITSSYNGTSISNKIYITD
ncbi:MAG: hypothetical protein J6B73_07125 [Methanobrevibacter sp.]|uniref:beta strand repeat-containing protein n=1 Tax=Methanobrevibacter sp. TaxID=66852 RepID=UPI001B0FF181|nr:right-handed parallel beta-helix repeat-containing protein [Methanobrevibacter sp.]MBO5151909.1 hypothetical protein [Methanobrevibacter sp.]